jgi:hypothetical protein
MLDHPGRLILIGFVLVLLGAVLPFLMIPSIKIITPSLFLLFLAYGAQISGLFLGVLGSAFYVRSKRRARDEHDPGHGGRLGPGQ